MLWRSYKYEISILFLFILSIVICRTLGITCLFFKITNFYCPTCNMTRALFSLLCGNLTAYIKYNAMALPVFMAFVGEIFNRAFGRYKRMVHIGAVVILIANLLYYSLKNLV